MHEGPTLMTSRNLNHFPKSSPPNTITWGDRVSTYESVGRRSSPLYSLFTFNLQIGCSLFLPQRLVPFLWAQNAFCHSPLTSHFYLRLVNSISPNTGMSSIKGGPHAPLVSNTASPQLRQHTVDRALNSSEDWAEHVDPRRGDIWREICWSESLAMAAFYILFHEICRFTFIFSHDISSATLSDSILFEYFHFKICLGVIELRRHFCKWEPPCLCWFLPGSVWTPVSRSCFLKCRNANILCNMDKTVGAFSVNKSRSLLS